MPHPPTVSLLYSSGAGSCHSLSVALTTKQVSLLAVQGTSATMQGAFQGKAHQSLSGLLQDIQLMRNLGIRNFRMSLAWPRLFPNGTGQLNQASVATVAALLKQCKLACYS